MQKVLVFSSVSGYSLPMTDLLFPSSPEEFEQYQEFLANGGNGVFEQDPDDSPEPDERDDYERDEWEPEDRYLDSSWEDANEWGMEGCCGDF